MAPLRVSITKSEWLPDDPRAFVPTRLWKLPFITTWDDSRNQNHPTHSAEEASFVHFGNGHASQVWSSELVVHPAGIPLALLVLLQDYRFLLLDAFVRFLAN